MRSIRRARTGAGRGGFTLVEAVLAIALLSIGVVSLLVVRDKAVAGARKTRFHQAAQRLAFDLVAQLEAGVYGEPRVGDVQYGIFVDNRRRFRQRDREDSGRTEYPAYPENEADPCYPPGLKFEWEITEEGQPAEIVPQRFASTDADTARRYEKRQQHYDDIQREMQNLDPDFTGNSGLDTLTDPEANLLEDEEKTEEVRTVTIFVRMDTAEQKDFLLFELEKEILWTYPDRAKNKNLDEESGEGGL